MRSLEEMRKELDVIDDQITTLYERRMKVCEGVAEYKIKNGRKVFDKTRENEKLAAVAEKVSTDFNKKGIRELFELPFIGLDQLDLDGARVVFQGVEGANNQAAMLKYFGKNVKNFHVPSFRDAMEAIEEGSADYAVLPIENSSAGPVTQVYDLLVEFENYIVGEAVHPIKHMRAGVKGTTLSSIERVYSHPQGLMQTSHFLDEHGTWQQISVANTSMAAKKMMEDQDTTQAAVCNEYAAELYGLDILAREINDEFDNSTRFIIVTNQKVFLKNASKISICFEIPHESGSLYHLLSHFIYNDLNMTKIESRPVEGKSWEYRFFVDFEGNLADAAVKNAIRGLREEALNLKILGNY